MVPFLQSNTACDHLHIIAKDSLLGIQELDANMCHECLAQPAMTRQVRDMHNLVRDAESPLADRVPIAVCLCTLKQQAGC